MNKMMGNASNDRTRDNTKYDKDMNMDASGRGMQNNIPERHNICQGISVTGCFVANYGEKAPGNASLSYIFLCLDYHHRGMQSSFCALLYLFV